MFKCLNCGSTAQPKVEYCHRKDRTLIMEIITCDCGCQIITHYTLQVETIRTKEGTLLKTRRGAKR